MSRFSSIVCLIILPFWLWGHEGPSSPISKSKHESHYFIENKGQWESSILFRAEIPQGNVLITRQGLTYQLLSFESGGEKLGRKTENPHAFKGPTLVKGQVVAITFQNSHFAKFVTVKKKVPGTFQYLRGKDKTKWVQGAKAFQEVEMKEVYKGIDLLIYFSKGLLKYDFIVHPGANPDQIAMTYDGADSLSLEENHLAIHTVLGKVLEKPPYSYQLQENKKNQISCAFHLKGNQVRFSLPLKYNPSQDLIIDPELLFTTYSGAKADNWGNTATYDSSGNFYSGGVIFSDSAFPVTPGPFQLFRNGNTDVLVLKYSPDGKDLLFAAYLGGSGAEIPISMIVNNKNELVVLGITGSNDFPVSTGAFDESFNGGAWIDAFFNLDGTPFQGETFEFPFDFGTDIFISIINTEANTLVASTFLGGTANDGIILSKTNPVRNYGDQLRGEVIIDQANNVYIASHTYSNTLDKVPDTSNLPKGNLDAVFAKFSPDLSTLGLFTRIGGSGHDSGFGIRLDSKGEVFITGSTNSWGLFSSSLPGLSTSPRGQTDGYIAKLSASDASMQNGTYLGTSEEDQCYFIDIDYNDHVYVFGLTNGNYPVTPKVFFNVDGGQFIHKLTNNLQTTLFSTKFGSGKRSPTTGKIMPDISPTAFMVNNCRKIFLSGWGGNVNPATESWFYQDAKGDVVEYTYQTGYFAGNISGMPVTPDAFQTTTNGTGFYFMILQPEALSLAYATYFSGTNRNREHVDGGTSRFDKKGVIYQSVCAGCGGLSNLPMPNNNVWSTTNNSNNCNNGAIKFDLGKVVANFETFDSLAAIPSIYGCVPITFLLKNKSSGATNYEWRVGAGQISTKSDSIFVTFTQRGRQELTLIAFDTTICRLVDTARAVINAGDVRVDFPRDRINCGAQPFTADLQLYTPWAAVKWESSTGLSDSTSPTPIITPKNGVSNYVITVNDDTLCTKVDTFRVTTRVFDPKAQFKVFDSLQLQEKYSFCFPSTAFFNSYSTDYDSLWWEEDNLLLFAGLDSFHYQLSSFGKIKYKLTVLDTACKKTSEEEKIITVSYPFVTFPSNITVCPDSSALVKVVGDPRYTYVWSPSRLFPLPNAMEQVLRPDTSGTVYIAVTDTMGCRADGSFQYGRYVIQEAISDREAKVCYKKVPGVNVYAIDLKEYDWSPGGYGGNPLYVTTEGKYLLKGITFDGCPVKDSIYVVQNCDPEIHVPDAFSPDGDGRNDFFQVFGHEVTTFDIKIFNRWGELIYHSTDFRFQWDGIYRNQTVPIGTYPYIISYSGTTFEGNKVTQTLSGDVTVVK